MPPKRLVQKRPHFSPPTSSSSRFQCNSPTLVGCSPEHLVRNASETMISKNDRPEDKPMAILCVTVGDVASSLIRTKAKEAEITLRL